MSEKDRHIALIVGRIYQCIGGLNVLGGMGLILFWLVGTVRAVVPAAPSANSLLVAMVRNLGLLGVLGILLGMVVLGASTAFLHFKPWGRRALIGISIFFMLFILGWALFMASIIPRVPGLPAFVPKAFAFASVIVFLVPFGLATHWLLSKPVKEMFGKS